MGYATPAANSRGKPATTSGSLVETGMWPGLVELVKHIVKNPRTFLRPALVQSMMIIQPINFEDDGRQDMCESRPDITVHEGKLVWRRRLEGLNQFAAFVTTVPKE